MRDMIIPVFSSVHINSKFYLILFTKYDYCMLFCFLCMMCTSRPCIQLVSLVWPICFSLKTVG
jgi:hypothetical protein